MRVKVKTNAKKNAIEHIDEQTIKVSLKKSPINGKANKELLLLLKNYFKK